MVGAGAGESMSRSISSGLGAAGEAGAVGGAGGGRPVSRSISFGSGMAAGAGAGSAWGGLAGSLDAVVGGS